MGKCLALMTRMKINTNILVFLSIFHTKILLNWSYFLEQKSYFLMKIRPKMVLKVLFLMTKILWEPCICVFLDAKWHLVISLHFKECEFNIFQTKKKIVKIPPYLSRQSQKTTTTLNP